VTDIDPNIKLLGGIFAPPGRGKTVASLRAFSGGLFIGPKNCFAPAETFLGFKPKIKEIATLSEAKMIAEHLASKGTTNPSIVVSDVSILAQNEVKAGLATGRNGWDVYRDLETTFLDLEAALRKLPVHSLLEFHYEGKREKEDSGKIKRKTFVPAGPQFPGWSVAKNIAGRLDFLAEVVPTDELISSAVWPFGICTFPDEDTIRKDRFNLFPELFPLNMREPLSLRGLHIPRHESVAWMDTPVKQLADKLFDLHQKNKLTPETGNEVTSAVIDAYSDKSSENITWLVLDAFDRAESMKHFTNRKSVVLSKLFSNIK
jgi:hypothetical protein